MARGLRWVWHGLPSCVFRGLWAASGVGVCCFCALQVNNRGDAISSADADGVVKLWDIRMVAEIGTIEVKERAEGRGKMGG